MRAAAAEQRYERAEALRRRRRRLGTVLGRLGGILEATHARPRLALAPHPTDRGYDCFWIAGGRLVDWGPLDPQDPDDLCARTDKAVARSGRPEDLGTHVPPAEIDEVRIIGSWLGLHPDTPQLPLRPAPDHAVLSQFVGAALSERGSGSSARERKLDDDGADLVGAHADL
jgi:DNA polymerase-3 subunit epsilon